MAKTPTETDVRGALKRFPFYHAGHNVTIAKTELVPDAITVSYRTAKGNHHNTTHLSLQVQGDICYIVGIGLEPLYRGTGLGEEFYGIAENIARQAGCKRVVMTPSGHTVTGEDRREYVKRKLGYTEINDVEVEKVL